jgi:hypothetical protein
MSAMQIHLVGSVPLADSAEVFRKVTEGAGGHVHRLPDGETGTRINWVRFIQEQLAARPDMEVDPTVPPIKWVQWDGKHLRDIHRLRFKPGTDLSRVTFATGYADMAIESFAVFDRLQKQGAIAPDTRFLVCMATSLAPGYNYISPHSRPDFVRLFTDHLAGEVARIARSIPHERLAVQWDVCQEVLMWENYYGEQHAGWRDEIIGVEKRLGEAVPAGAHLGYHLCYGSPADEHLIMPKDMGVMVEMTNDIVHAVQRPVEFFHLPVPRERSDDAFFAPLDRLCIDSYTELHFGLVHLGDEVGDAARLAAVRRHARVDGVGTECGWGRKNPGQIPALLAQHRRLVETKA